MIPTCIAQIIPRLTRKNTAPYFTFFLCVCCNIGIGFLISYFIDDYEIDDNTITLVISIILLVIGYLPQIIPFSICCCSTSFEGNNFLIAKEFFGKFESHKDFLDKLSKNRVFAPVITVFSEASHTETYTTTSTDSNGNTTTHTSTKKVVTYRNRQQFRYNSWQEEGNPIRVWPGTSVIHAVIKVNYRLDGESKRALNWLKKFMYRDARRHDIDVDVSVKFSVPGMSESLCGTTLDDVNNLPCCVNFLRSFFGKIFFILMSLAGYQSIVAGIWCSHGERLRLKLVKRISMRPKNEAGSFGGSDGSGGLRAGYLEKDMVAMQYTFHTDNIEAPILMEPLVNYTEQYQQPLNYSPYYNAYLETPYYQNFVNNNYVDNANSAGFPEVDAKPYLPTPPPY